jgi:SAM-dependent methyltransferase
MHSPLLNQCLHELKHSAINLPILDLACGSGRNGLFLLEQDFSVIFSDIKSEALAEIKQAINNKKQPLPVELASFLQVDLEQQGANLLQENSYSSILVFRYLHRPLIKQIKAAVSPNGLVIYETFTTEQAEFGGPKNPDFLLKAGELASYFSDWQILHSFEGVKISDSGTSKQAVAQIIARKP